MNVSFIRDRITELRIKKNVSECKMSLELGHSKTYIQNISSGKALPSISEFLSICDYLGVTPKEFFDTETAEIQRMHRLIYYAQTLSPESLDILIDVANQFGQSTSKQK